MGMKTFFQKIFGRVLFFVVNNPVKAALFAAFFDIMLVFGLAYFVSATLGTPVEFSSNVDRTKNAVVACLYSANENVLYCEDFTMVVVKIFGNAILGTESL